MARVLVWAALAALWACDDGGGEAAQAGRDAAADDAALPDAGGDHDGPVDDASVPDAMSPEPADIEAPGPFPVGFAEGEMTYVAPALGEARTLRLAWWYPAAAAEGDAVRYAGIVPSSAAHRDAPPTGEAAPLLVFSHGNGGFAEQSFFLGEFLASHGFVVVAPDHTGNTFRDLNGVSTLVLFELRPQDILALIDHALAEDATHPLAGLLDGRVAVSGHSFGGYTTLANAGGDFRVDDILAGCEGEEVCAYLEEAAPRYAAGFGDPRVMAGIALTPAGATVFTPTLGNEAPVLMITAGRDATLPNPDQGDPLWAGLDGPGDGRVDLPQAGHFSFTSMCPFIGALGADDGCSDDFLDLERVAVITRTYALAFLRLHVLGDDSHLDLLEGAELPFGDDAIVEYRP